MREVAERGRSDFEERDCDQALAGAALLHVTVCMFMCVYVYVRSMYDATAVIHVRACVRAFFFFLQCHLLGLFSSHLVVRKQAASFRDHKAQKRGKYDVRQRGKVSEK